MPRIANPVRPVRLRLAPPRITAGVAQLVERDLAKVEVTSSSLVTRSKDPGSRRWSRSPNREQKCGCSSVGRARPCQGRGHEFEPRYPLQLFKKGSPAASLFYCSATLIMRPVPGW